MKTIWRSKFTTIMMALAVLLALAFAYADTARAAAPGTVTVTVNDAYDVVAPRTITKRQVILTWLASVDDASVPDTTINATTYNIKGWYLYSAMSKPSGTAPTANYDITVIDVDGADAAGTLLTNRSASAAELVNFGTAASGYPAVMGNLVVKWANNLVNSAGGVVKLLFQAY